MGNILLNSGLSSKIPDKYVLKIDVGWHVHKIIFYVSLVIFIRIPGAAFGTSKRLP